MKTLFLKSTGVLVLMAAMGSAMAFPPPPPAPTTHYSVTNYTQQTTYQATGSWPRVGNSDTKAVAPTNSVTFNSDGTWAEAYDFQVTVRDSNGNTCSAAGHQDEELTVTSNPSSSATWSCVADGANLKVVPLS